MNKSQLGGLRCIALHGNPGTAEGRRKGGKTTIRLFHRDPALAKRLGFVIRKTIRYPGRCVELAELVGIILGDGGLSGNYQLVISFNRITDVEYAQYLRSLLKKLFAINSYIHYRKNNNGADIVVTSSNLVDFLEKQGLIKGNKVKHQVSVPEWILQKREYRRACLRGLMDTDGGLYLHRYDSHGRSYEYLKLCFTNCSKPLLDFVFNTLKELDYKVFLNGKHVSIYSSSEVKRYICQIGSSNPKHLKKFSDHLGEVPESV